MSVWSSVLYHPPSPLIILQYLLSTLSLLLLVLLNLQITFSLLILSFGITNLQTSLPCIALPYLTLSYLTLPYLTLPYLTLPYLTLPYLTLPYRTLPYLTLPYLTLPYLTLPYLALPYRTLPYHRTTYVHLLSCSSSILQDKSLHDERLRIISSFNRNYMLER